MIYIDTSVALAQIFAEDVLPPRQMWDDQLVSSRLLEYELWVRINARAVGASHGEVARQLLQRIAFVELATPVLARAREPFPAPVRTLDALHLATADFLRVEGQRVQIATYDTRMIAAARKMKFPLYPMAVRDSEP